jgi:hypothetical protein
MDQHHTQPENAGASIVTREPEERKVTPEVVEQLKQGGASRDLVDFAKRHVDKNSEEPKLSAG